MKRRTWLLVGCTALLSLILIQPVFAHGWGYNDDDYGRPMNGGPGFQGGYPPNGMPYGGYGYREHRHMPDMRHSRPGLDLSDKQHDAIHEIMRNARSDFRHLEEKIRDKRSDLYDLIDEGKDMKKINTLADEIGALMAQRIKLRASIRIKIMKVLTADQRKEARDMPMPFFGWGYDDYRY